MKKGTFYIVIGVTIAALLVMGYFLYKKKAEENLSPETPEDTLTNRQRLAASLDNIRDSYTSGTENETTDTGNVGISSTDQSRIDFIDKKVQEIDKELMATFEFFKKTLLKAEKSALLSEKEQILAKY